MSTDEESLLVEIDLAIQKAASVLNMDDFIHLDVDLDEHGPYWDALEERHHCGTCTVRTVMEIVWPSIEKLIDFMRDWTPTTESDNDEDLTDE